MLRERVLVTGGVGFIGSHTVIKLLENDFQVTILDNLSNSNIGMLQKISKITNGDFNFLRLDLRDERALANAFEKHSFDAVMHFAALKSISDSFTQPIEYYENNLVGTMSLLKVMNRFAVNKLIFSSTASVYEAKLNSSANESMPTKPSNPYAKSKLACENIIEDFSKSGADFKYIALRYFNPVGAHGSGLIGEDLNQPSSNLFPVILRAILGVTGSVKIFGNKYLTPDGTGMRDYIHIEDLADGHIRALEYLIRGGEKSLILNIGTGQAHSVLEVLRTFENIIGRQLPKQFVSPRNGDIPFSAANVELIKKTLGWASKYSLEEMCRDSLRAAISNNH